MPPLALIPPAAQNADRAGKAFDAHPGLFVMNHGIHTVAKHFEHIAELFPRLGAGADDLFGQLHADAGDFFLRFRGWRDQ